MQHEFYGAELLHGMWNPLRSGMDPESLALPGRLLTTVPPMKPYKRLFMVNDCLLDLKIKQKQKIKWTSWGIYNETQINLNIIL